jgi:hypothetical protein
MPSKLAEWQESYPALQVLTEARQALQWLRDNPHHAKTARGMPRFLGAWLARSQNNGGTFRGQKQTGSQYHNSPAAATERIRAGEYSESANAEVQRLKRERADAALAAARTAAMDGSEALSGDVGGG